MIPPSARQSGLTLLEVLFAGLILTLAFLPAVELLTSSSQGTIKARDRLIATFAAMAVVEEQKSRPAPGNVARTALKDLPAFQPILGAYAAAHPTRAATIDRMLGNVQCQVTVIDMTGRPGVRSDVTWDEAGTPRSISFDARMESP